MTTFVYPAERLGIEKRKVMAKDEMTAYERAMLEETRAHNARMLAAVEAQRTEAQPFVEASPDVQFKAMSDARRGRDVPPLRTSKVANCLSPVTSATFTACLDHHDRIVRFEDYQEPEGVDKSVDEGGLVPSGLKIGQPLHQQWKWSGYWQADINAHVGKPINKYMKAEADERTARLASQRAEATP